MFYLEIRTVTADAIAPFNITWCYDIGESQWNILPKHIFVIVKCI